MTPTLAFALIAAVLAVISLIRSRGDDLTAWGVLALAVALAWPVLR